MTHPDTWTADELHAYWESTGERSKPVEIDGNKRTGKTSKEHQRLDWWLETHFGDVLHREYRFHEPKPGEKRRQWRFDYALMPDKIAIEFEGVLSHSAHTSITNVVNDAAKFNAASLQGWIVIRVNTKSLESGQAYNDIYDALALRDSRPADSERGAM